MLLVFIILVANIWVLSQADTGVKILQKNCPATEYGLFHKTNAWTAQLIPICKQLKIFQDILRRNSYRLGLPVLCRGAKQPAKQEEGPSFPVTAACSVLHTRYYHLVHTEAAKNFRQGSSKQMNLALWFVRLQKHTTTRGQKQENTKQKTVTIQVLGKSGKTTVSALHVHIHLHSPTVMVLIFFATL